MGRNTVLVTGVSRGIGRAIADRLAAEGYEVIGVSRGPAPGLHGTHYAVDLAQEGARPALARIAETHAPCRLVANAGIVRSGALAEIADADFDATMRVNLLSVIWAMQALAPTMRAEGFGRIVTLGSRAALGKPGRGVYSASKAGIVGLTRTMALELAEAGITVNCVAPGPIETEIFAQNQPAGSPARDALVAQVPLRRMGTPDEIAHAAAYLLSDGAGFTTGQVLHVCGGLSVGGMMA